MPGGRFLGMLTRYRGGVGVAAAVVTLAVLGPLEPIELGALDVLFEIRGPRHPVAPIVIVSIDESSFVELNEQWPFPRAMHARLLDAVAAGQPLAIGVDVIFDQPSSRGPKDDAELGAAVARAGHVVLGAAPATDVQVLTTRYVPNLPLSVISSGAAGTGALNLIHDPDSKVRRAPRHMWTGAERLPSLAAELHRVVTAAGLPGASLPPSDEILVNFSGPPTTFPWVPYYQVITGEVRPEFFRGKIVLIGPTSEPMHDVFATPFTRGGELMPGVEIHANVLETYLRGNPVRALGPVVSTTLAVVGALAAAALVGHLHPLRALGAVVALWTLVVLVAYGVFVHANLWLGTMATTLALALGYGVSVVDHFVRERRERRRLSQFFSPEVLREVVRDSDRRGLGSSRRLVTVLFCDIRGFTALAEKLAPEDVAEMLREYLSEMTEVIFRHGGTVDKYVGDCVMALYNAPLDDPHHVRNAMRTALDLQERTLEVATRWEARLGSAIRSGIGINTGEAVVGTLGSRQRLEYTAIGDTINLGSRLESLTKEYGVAIVISEFTRQHLTEEFVTRELGEVTVRGRSRPVKIYGVLPSDVRKHPRAALDVGGHLVLVGGAGQVCPVSVRDVGEGGMAVDGVPDAWSVGTRVEVQCEGGLLPGPLRARGAIVWRRGAEAGIAFSGIDPDTTPTVAEYVAQRHHDPGRARRPRGDEPGSGTRR
jgi:adenylate cyclase